MAWGGLWNFCPQKASENIDVGEYAYIFEWDIIQSTQLYGCEEKFYSVEDEMMLEEASTGLSGNQSAGSSNLS